MTSKYCELCHTSPPKPDGHKYHHACEESFQDPNLKEIWGRIYLTYFKQGDDLHAALRRQDGKNSLVKALRNHQHLLQFSADRLGAIAEYMDENQLTTDEFRIEADSHLITIFGPADAMRDLINEGHVWFTGPYINQDPDGNPWRNLQPAF